MIIFINGNLNSGKSTISRGLSEKLGNSAIVEIDRLREFIWWMPVEEAVPLSLENAICIIKNFTRHKLNVIVPYVITQKNYAYLESELADLDEKRIYITLDRSLEQLLNNSGNREHFEQDAARIQVLFGRRVHKPTFGTIIDTTNLSVDQTIDEVMKIVIG